MGQISARTEIDIDAEPARVITALENYTEVRPRILPPQYRDLRIIEGGTGAGTVATWTLQATEKRSRDVRATVSVAGEGTATTPWELTEIDGNSSMVTTYTVRAHGAGSRVATETRWKGAGGVGGFFERTFAPGGVRRIQAALLDNLRAELA